MTTKQPINKEGHFILTELLRDEQERIIGCLVEAVINNNSYQIDWKTLQDETCCLIGWK